MSRLLRLWTLPNTLLFLALAHLTGCENRGLYWLGTSRPWRWWSRRFGMDAVTCGTVIICTRPPSIRTLRHEWAHVRQALVLGPLYLPVYFTLCLWGLLLPGRHWYFDHPMEVAARRG